MKSLLTAGLIALAAGCAPRAYFTPAPSATAVPPLDAAAQAESSGVRIVVNGRAWPSRPAPTTFEPLKVSIHNRSEHPLRIWFDQFQLVEPGGKQVAALSPLDLSSGLGGSGGGAPPESGPPGKAWPAGTPSEEVVRNGVPQGVVREHNGYVSGFLYFPPLAEGVKRVDFRAALVDAQTGEQFGEVRIPLRVIRR